MHRGQLDADDVAALARANGLDATPERVAALVATLRIVNPMRARLWARPCSEHGEPSHMFAPAKGRDEA